MMYEMSSRLSKKQAIGVLIWLPVHLLVLPILLSIPVALGMYDDLMANLLVYAIGTLYMLLILRRFFRRDFDPICEHPFRTLFTLFACYFLARFGEIVVAVIIDALSVTGDNDNNEAVIEMAKSSIGPTAAMAVFLAPIVEECLFRAGIFGLLRRKSRVLAYAVSMLLFGLYHVWQGAIYDLTQLIFILEYLPSAFALAYAYERTDSIWGSIFLHMLSNGVAMLAVTAA